MIETYANGDEALFADASLPRDDYGFRVSSGVNTRQQDFRTANSGINMAQFLVLGIDRISGQTTLSNDTFCIAKFKNKYSSSDFPSATLYDGTSASSLYNKDTKDKFGVQSLGLPYAKINKDGYIEITKSGTYVVQPVCTFLRESGTSYSTSTSYQVKEYIRLYSYEKNTWNVKFSNQQRACGAADMVSLTYVAWLESGTILTVGALHTLGSSGNCVIEPGVNLYRLS